MLVRIGKSFLREVFFLAVRITSFQAQPRDFAWQLLCVGRLPQVTYGSCTLVSAVNL